MLLLEQIRTIDKTRLQDFLGKIDYFQLQQIDNALIDTFGMNIIGYLKSLGLGGYKDERQTQRIYSDYYYEKK